MRQLKLRFATADDAKTLDEWLRGNKDNQYDSAIWKYPTLQTLCAYDTGPVGFLPVQRVLMLESVAMDPQATELMKACVLRDLTKAATLVASSHGIREMYFLGGHGGVGDLARKQGHQFEELPYRVFRMRVS